MLIRYKNRGKCAFLTISDLSEFECYDHLLIEPMKSNGLELSFLPWDEKDIDWNDYDYVIVRSTWNYQSRLNDFIGVLNKIENSNAMLINPIEAIKWNIKKSYLIDLEKRGVSIIPSIFQKEYDPEVIYDTFQKFDCDKIVLKPVVGANASFTELIRRSDLKNSQEKLQSNYSNRPFIIQPFFESVITKGELSLIFFNNKLSHGISKIPKMGDFRVQEEHGGIISLLNRVNNNILDFCDKILSNLPEICFYARIDLLLENDFPFLMEVELIEPSLYFNMKPGSNDFFANELVKYLEGTSNQ